MVKESKNAVLSSGLINDFGTGERKFAPNQTSSWSVVAPASDPAGRTAFRLIAEVYRWFSFDDEDIPYTDESSEGRIVSAQSIIDLNKK